MRPSVLTLAFVLASLTPLAAAEAPMGMADSMQRAVSIGIRMTHDRNPLTPSWIGDYSTRWLRMQMTTPATMGNTPTCAEAEGNPMKLLSLQRVGACPTVKTSTRIGW